MYYTLYQITNKINNKIYIGVHKTDNLEDDYMGSGIAIKNALKKYGLENFTKEILFLADSENEMYDLEEYIVDEEFTKRKDTYNISLGGNKVGITDVIKEKISINTKKAMENPEIRRKISISKLNKKQSQKTINKRVKKLIGQKRSKEFKLYIKEFKTGQTHTEETKRKISISKLGSNPWNKGTLFNIVKCPHCNKEGGENAMKRYHFDNCGKKHTGSWNKGVKEPILKCPHCNKEGGRNAMKRYHFDNCKYNF